MGCKYGGITYRDVDLICLWFAAGKGMSRLSCRIPGG